MRVIVTNCGAELELDRGTILDAAIRAGLPYPHGCRAGNCGSCRSRLLEGRVRMDSHAPEALSPGEAEDGLILACRARPLSDVRVEWLDTEAPLLPRVRRLRGRTVSVDRLTRDITRLRLEVPGEPLFFLPGQYAELGFSDLPHSPYSMASAPGDPVLEFHIRAHPKGIGSRYARERLRPPDPVDVRGPFGSAFLRPGARPLLAVGGGSGYGPIRSILLAALRRDPDAPIHLYLGVRDEADLYPDPEVRALAGRHAGLRYVPVLSAPSARTSRRTGLAHEAIERDFDSLTGFAVHAAGPPPMVEAVRALALRLGVRPENVHADPFEVARHPAAARGRASRGLWSKLAAWLPAGR